MSHRVSATRTQRLELLLKSLRFACRTPPRIALGFGNLEVCRLYLFACRPAVTRQLVADNPRDRDVQVYL